MDTCEGTFGSHLRDVEAKLEHQHLEDEDGELTPSRSGSGGHRRSLSKKLGAAALEKVKEKVKIKREAMMASKRRADNLI